MAPSGSDQSEASHAHLGRELFSNHFLEVRLRDDDLWEEVADEAAALRSRLRELLAEQGDALEGANEDQTEERWVKPVLRALGWGYEVQPASKRHGSVQYPDYALFLSQVDADEAAALRERRRVLKQADGVLEAKRWGRDLDAGDPARDDINRVPSTQIINYLIRAEQPWGVLTNGTEWRLYHRDADFADTSYFAVDLRALLGDEPLRVGERGETVSPEEAFRFFYLFFRPEAFRVETEDRRWLDLAYRRSVRYARAVEKALKPRAYRAVEAICRGFVAAHDLEPHEVEDAEELATNLLDNALTLLFRLLFLHYAESRDLLPVRTNATYRRKSLLALRERAAEQRDAGEDFIPRGRDYWDDLRALFGIVDGAPEWRMEGIPVYNGGLFDSEKHLWLEEHYVADPHLAEALDLLSRSEDPETGEMHYVDYGPLDVRNLGSIYEGLLEHKLQVAEEEQPAVREEGRTLRDRVPEGELYLANDKGERKTTGSYYTPDYVVEYIVERSLSSLVEGRTPSEILELTVLDPAMGSGHFLVSATSFLARQAVRAVEEGEQHLLGEFAELDPDQLRRLVVERCIFGVDKNPRAVELAKLSLWIATVQKGKPLNFLDHHLKCGDSLLGAHVGQLGSLPDRTGETAALEQKGQLNAFERAFREQVGRVLDLIQDIERSSSDTLDDVRHKEEMHHDAERLLERFRGVGDLWCSVLFGNPALEPKETTSDEKIGGGAGDRFSQVVRALEASPDQWQELEAKPWMQSARGLANEHRFFHWEVEFSEVFYDEEGGRREEPGFDAVLGNPPYVRMEAFKGLKDFLRHVYETHATRTDLYVYFMERSVELLREGGEYGVIVSNKFLRANYGRGIRALLADRVGVREVVDFGELPVFEDASTMPALLFGRRGQGVSEPRYAQVTTLDFPDLVQEVERRAYEFEPDGLDGEDWQLVPREVAAVMERMEERGQRLGKLVDGQLLRGIVTGRNRAFFIDDNTRERLVDEDPRSEEVIKPLVVGNDIQRFRIEREKNWILYMPHGVDIDRYPAVEEHLASYREELEGRATDQEWYELQQPQEAYREFFDGPKVLYPVIAQEARFAYNPGPLYPNDKCFFIPRDDRFLVALLNSRLVYFYLAQVCSTFGNPAEGGRLEFRAQYMERLPVRWPSAGSKQEGRGHLLKWLRTLYSAALRRVDLSHGSTKPSELKELFDAVAEETGLEPVPPETEGRRDGRGVHDAFPEVLTQADIWLSEDVSGGQVATEQFLGHLARTMAELHERRLEEVADFLDWLEEQLGCPVDDLTGKTYVRAYWEQPEGVDKLLETIERNRPSSTELDVRKPEEYGETNPDRERIISGYDRSMKTLRPLLRQLQLTDGLIDQIVYQLYGLTDEEIDVVEEYVA